MDFKLEEISMQIITFAGTAKSLALEMIDTAKAGESVDKIVEEIEENIRLAGEQHFKIISASANPDVEIKPDVLFIHAEDQMMSAETIYLLAKQIISFNEK